MRTKDLVCYCSAGNMQQVRQIVELCEESGQSGGYQNYDVNGQWGRSGTPLCTAIKHGQNEVAKYLMSRPIIDINKEGCGWTPLHWACACGDEGNVEMINLLVRDHRITSLNKGSSFFRGYTPLMSAVWCCKVASVRALLAVPGVDLNIRNDNGKSVMDVAREMGKLEILRMLEEHQRSGVQQEAAVSAQRGARALAVGRGLAPDCPVCLEEMTPPKRIFLCISQNSCGISVCETCRNRLTRCPNCREILTGDRVRNITLEQLLQN